MKQRITSVILTMLISMWGMNVWSQESEPLSFGVISDIHFDNHVGEGAMVKVPKALKNLTSYKALDAIAIAGDLADAGRDDQFEQLVSVFNDKANYTNPVGDLLFMMGNHDHNNGNGVANYQNGLSVFNGGEAYPLHQYKIIKGYPFITISMESASSTGGYPQELQQKLDEWMAQAAKECPGKPIFVFTHVPPQWTVYGSWPEFENGSTWGSKSLNAVLNKYPQAVVFAGHSHYPMGDPLSIHQGTNPNSSRMNYYTVINTGSTTYSEVHPGAVAAGIHPEGYAYVTEGLIVTELPNGDIELRRYDTYRNLEIGADHRWVLKAPFDGSMFEYADIRDADDNPNNRPLRDGLPAPAFTKSAEVKVKYTPYDAEATFPQATDDECVFRYRIRVAKAGLVISEKYIFSQFYMNTDTPNPLKFSISNLVPQAAYSVEVVAYDSYGNASVPLKAEFQTPEADAGNIVPEPDGKWTFEDKDDLMKVEAGNMSMTPYFVGKQSVTAAESLEAAGIVSVDGPSDDNKAILVPRSSTLKVLRETTDILQDYTILMDIKMESAMPYNGLIQTNMNNTNDGDLFIYQNTIGMNALGGYFGEIKDDTWYRIVMKNSGGYVYVYVDGELLIKHASATRWELDPFFFLFCDENDEMNDTYVAEIVYWEKGLADNQVRALSGLPIIEDPFEPYMVVKTPNVKVTEDLEFSIKVDANVPFTFELPEWIMPIDVQPFEGERSYTFRALPMDDSGRREAIIGVNAEGFDYQEVQVIQVYMGAEIPEARGVWTFDDKNNLMYGGSYEAILEGAMKTDEGPQTTKDLEAAGIVSVDGPLDENLAITIPADAYLWLTPNIGIDVLSDYTIMYDIKPCNLIGYKSLFQYDVTNKTDAGLFIKDNHVGRGGAGNMIGYVADLQSDTWYRLLFVVKDSRAILYLNGEYIGESTNPQDFWTITREALLFADEDGEEGPLDLAELRFWDVPLSAEQAMHLGDVFKDVDEYFAVQTSSIRLINKTEFSIPINSNVPFTFQLPDWVEPVDAEFAEGLKEYTFRAQEMEPGRRIGTIKVVAEYFDPHEVEITQIQMGDELPEATGCWTFDDPNNLMAGTGTAIIQAAFNTPDGPEITDDPLEALIEPVAGPNEKNGAIGMPVDAFLMMTTNVGVSEMKDYSILFDVCPLSLNGYYALLQTNPRNTSDGAFYIKNGAIGLNNTGLGYHGIMQLAKWHRIVFVVKDGYANTFLDGERVGQSTGPNALWTLLPQALLFADDNGEDNYNEIAEVRFWDVPLSDEHVMQLGGVEQEWEDDPMIDPISVWTFDNEEDPLAGTGPAELRVAVKTAEGPVATDDLAAAGIVKAEGPTKSNGAITVPIDTYLQMAHNQEEPDQTSFTILMDIRPKVLGVYNALFQSHIMNNQDGSLYINKSNQLGINTAGLGYGGRVEEGQWLRIVFIVNNCSITTFLNGDKIGSSTSASTDKWTLHEIGNFFADDDGEEGVIDVAEMWYWNEAISVVQAHKLGGVDTETAIGKVQDVVSKSATGLFDLQGRKISLSSLRDGKLQKGLYILNGKKVMIK